MMIAPRTRIMILVFAYMAAAIIANASVILFP